MKIIVSPKISELQLYEAGQTATPSIAKWNISLMQHCAGFISAEWPCRNKTCTEKHQVGVSFDLYYDARKHKNKIQV